VSADYRAIFTKIGDVIRDQPGPFEISGHTDNVPIRTVRFPSNWHLAKARAEAVAAIVGQAIGDPGKLRIEARADAQPLAANDTADGRALNRRVEIKVPLATAQALQ
jgi:type VI secretion system protein ImpK